MIAPLILLSFALSAIVAQTYYENYTPTYYATIFNFYTKLNKLQSSKFGNGVLISKNYVLTTALINRTDHSRVNRLLLSCDYSQLNVSVGLEPNNQVKKVLNVIQVEFENETHDSSYALLLLETEPFELVQNTIYPIVPKQLDSIPTRPYYLIHRDWHDWSSKNFEAQPIIMTDSPDFDNTHDGFWYGQTLDSPYSIGEPVMSPEGLIGLSVMKKTDSYGDFFHGFIDIYDVADKIMAIVNK